MQTPLNLWIWKYNRPRSHERGYHLRADEAACRSLIERLNHAEFIKVSYALRQVPRNMPLILQTSDPRFTGFHNLRLFGNEAQDEALVADEIGTQLNIHLNAEGKKTLTEGLEAMAKGDWDFWLGGIWYWGLLTEADYARRYGAAT